MLSATNLFKSKQTGGLESLSLFTRLLVRKSRLGILCLMTKLNPACDRLLYDLLLIHRKNCTETRESKLRKDEKYEEKTKDLLIFLQNSVDFLVNNVWLIKDFYIFMPS